jgi:hypothetical protein
MRWEGGMRKNPLRFSHRLLAFTNVKKDRSHISWLARAPRHCRLNTKFLYRSTFKESCCIHCEHGQKLSQINVKKEVKNHVGINSHNWTNINNIVSRTNTGCRGSRSYGTSNASCTLLIRKFSRKAQRHEYQWNNNLWIQQWQEAAETDRL